MRRWRATPMILVAFVCGFCASLLPVSSAEAQQPFDEWTDREMEELLLNGDVVDRRNNGRGITGSEIATLDNGDVQHDAQIQDVYEQATRKEFENGRIEFGFTDYYTYNIAGYRLDRLIGLNMAPVAVERQNSAYVWWFDNVLMGEDKRYLESIPPPRPGEWGLQIRHVNIFQELIYNTDGKNLQNMLILEDWQVRLIDFTRAFRNNKDLLAPENLPNSIAPHIYDGLMSLTKDVLEEAMDDLLTGTQIDAILARRDIIVEHFDSLAEEQGAAVVFR